MNRIDDIKKSLLARQQEIESRLAEIKTEVRREQNPLPGDWKEQVVERENDEVLDALGNAAREELVLVKKALARIESEDYLYCSQCGEEIGKERLRMLPYADLCVECASRQESLRR
ncbi:MAG: TraR/DksA family transcriptional regulator [Gammaproteobacteria bacterium]|nr:MAG: TraR/DksA family transcriptional regulator [Gammaproteobacteria bacterium]